MNSFKVRLLVDLWLQLVLQFLGRLPLECIHHPPYGLMLLHGLISLEASHHVSYGLVLIQVLI